MSKSAVSASGLFKAKPDARVGEALTDQEMTRPAPAPALIREVIPKVPEVVQEAPKDFVLYERPMSVSVALRIPPDLHKHYRLKSLQTGISINKLLTAAIEAGKDL